MKSVGFSAIVILLVFGIVGCGGSSINVRSDYDPATDFSKIKTFRYMDVKRDKDDPLSSSLISGRVRAAIEKALITKGFQKLDAGQPDFFAAALGGAKEKMNVTSYGYSYGPYWGGYGGYGGYPSGGNIDVSYYTEASLVIDIITAKADKNELLWRGVGTGTFQRGQLEPEEAQARADRAVDLILMDFPPTKK